MNKMYEYLKNHAYISYNKKSTYEFELSEERAECIANKYDSLTEELQQGIRHLDEVNCKLRRRIGHFEDNCIELKKTNKKQKEVIDKVRNNLEKDISVIKNVKMSNKEIICRLEETNKMLKKVSE